MTQTTTEQTTIEVVETEQVEKHDEDKDKKRHIINPPLNTHIWRFGMSSQDVVDIARVKGLHVVALCGEEFIPTRNPESIKETCNVCIDAAGIIMSESGND